MLFLFLVGIILKDRIKCSSKSLRAFDLPPWKCTDFQNGVPFTFCENGTLEKDFPSRNMLFRLGISQRISKVAIKSSSKSWRAFDLWPWKWTYFSKWSPLSSSDNVSLWTRFPGSSWNEAINIKSRIKSWSKSLKAFDLWPWKFTEFQKWRTLAFWAFHVGVHSH